MFVSKTLFSHELRILMCDHCGAAIDVLPQGGHVKCRYCSAVNVLTRRDESADIAEAQQARRAPISEYERLMRLRRQDNKPLLRPPSLQHYLVTGEFAHDRLHGALADWLQNRKRVQRGASLAESERLVHLTLMLLPAVDQRRQRALLENSVEALPEKQHRQILRCELAHLAVLAGDLHAAHEWLQPCNARSTDLQMDTAYRLATSYLATANGSWNKVLTMVGAGVNDVPIADGRDEEATVLRANAVEHKGQLKLAMQHLVHWMTPDIRRFGDLEQVMRTNRALRLCRHSYSRVRDAMWRQTEATIRPGKPIGKLVGATMLLSLGGALLYATYVSYFAAHQGAVPGDGGNAAIYVNTGIWGAVTALLGLGLIRSAIKQQRLRVDGVLTFGRLLASELKVVTSKNSRRYYQRMSVDIVVPGTPPGLVRATIEVQGRTAPPAGVYPCLVHASKPNNSRIRLH